MEIFAALCVGAALGMVAAMAVLVVFGSTKGQVKVRLKDQCPECMKFGFVFLKGYGPEDTAFLIPRLRCVCDFEGEQS